MPFKFEIDWDRLGEIINSGWPFLILLSLILFYLTLPMAIFTLFLGFYAGRASQKAQYEARQEAEHEQHTNI